MEIPVYRQQNSIPATTGAVNVSAEKVKEPFLAEAQQGAAISKIGFEAANQVAQFQAAEKRAERVLEAQKIENTLKEAVANAKLDIDRNPLDYSKFEPYADTKIGEIKAQHIDSIADPLVKRAAELAFMTQSGELKRYAKTQKIKTMTEESTNLYEADVIRGEEAYAREVNPDARAIIKGTLQVKGLELESSNMKQLGSTERRMLQFEHNTKKLESGYQGNAIGTEIFKADLTGSLENMTDELRKRNLPIDTADKAEAQIKDLYNQRKIDETYQQKKAIDKVNAKLSQITLNSRGIAKQSDLAPEEWAELTKKAPEYAVKLQDSMRKEQDYLVSQTRRGAIEAKQLKALEQDENEKNILVSDDFTDRDLKQDLALNKIDIKQYKSLSDIQKKMDPLKRDSVKTAFKRVTEGTDLAQSLGGISTNEDAIWKQKYGNLVKAFAYKYADEPNFDTKLSEFVETKILSELVTDIFKSRDTERKEKFEEARKVSGDLPQRRATDKPVNSSLLKTVGPSKDFDEANIKSQEQWISNNENKIKEKLKGKKAGTYTFPGNSIPILWNGESGFTISIKGNK